jgi:hypothetical protein
MRLIALIVALIAASAPAAAQSWTEYTYPEDFFSVSFPTDPTKETTTYQTVDGRSVEARVYSASLDGSVFKMMVIDTSGASTAEKPVIDHAVKTLFPGGEVKLDIEHRISRIYGRQLSILGPDGSRSMAALFDHNGRLYMIEGKALPTAASGTADAIRFQQSLVFTDDGTNR